jgi:hypothetical protein
MGKEGWLKQLLLPPPPEAGKGGQDLGGYLPPSLVSRRHLRRQGLLEMARKNAANFVAAACAARFKLCIRERV